MEEKNELDTRYEVLKIALQEQNLSDFRENFLELHIYEQGQFYESLTEKERAQMYSYLSPKELADMFDSLEEDEDALKEYLEEMRPSYAAAMLSAMYTDNAVDLLNLLGKKDTAKYLSLMSPE
ncbi:MAG: magnesium transporter, partial [Enterococcus aquimarinus]